MEFRIVNFNIGPIFLVMGNNALYVKVDVRLQAEVIVHKTL